MIRYLCPDCGESLTDQGLFGKPSFRRYRCDNDACVWKGTSYPESALIRRLQFAEGGDDAA